MGWNNAGLSDNEFYKEACRFADAIDMATAKKWWQAFTEVIIRHIYFDGSCRVPDWGTFTTRTVTEQIQVQKGPDGRQAIYRVPERRVPVFTPHDNMIDDINMTGVTKAYRRRLRNGNLTERDYYRQCRAEALGVVGSLSEERLTSSKEKFRKQLEQMKKEYAKKQGKVVEEDADDTE